MEELKEIYLSTYFLIKLNSIKNYPIVKSFLNLIKILSDYSEQNLENHLILF